MAIGLVEAEAEGAARAGVPEEPEQLLERADEAVDVGPVVDVGVEDLGPGRDAGAQLVLVRGDEGIGALEHVSHGVEGTGSSRSGREPAGGPRAPIDQGLRAAVVRRAGDRSPSASSS